MEIKVNKEIREYTESIYFGLSLRQFICSLSACCIAILLYFLFRAHFSVETLSWICISGAMPFACLGFVRYHGMNAEEIICAIIKDRILTPKKILFKPTNLYYQLINKKYGGFNKNENNKKFG